MNHRDLEPLWFIQNQLACTSTVRTVFFEFTSSLTLSPSLRFGHKEQAGNQQVFIGADVQRAEAKDLEPQGEDSNDIRKKPFAS
jgi:hypothetical protein